MNIVKYIANELYGLLQLPLPREKRLEILRLVKERIKAEAEAQKVLSFDEWRSQAKALTMAEAIRPNSSIKTYARSCDPREVVGFYLYPGQWIIEILRNDARRFRYAMVEETSSDLQDIEAVAYEFYRDGAAHAIEGMQQTMSGPRITIVGIGGSPELLAELEAIFNPKPNR